MMKDFATTAVITPGLTMVPRKILSFSKRLKELEASLKCACSAVSLWYHLMTAAPTPDTDIISNTNNQKAFPRTSRLHVAESNMRIPPPSYWRMLLALAPVFLPFSWPPFLHNFADASYGKTFAILTFGVILLPFLLTVSLTRFPQIRVAVLSVWTYGVWKYVLKPLPVLSVKAKMSIANRLEAWDEAVNKTTELRKENRFHRTSRYDVYVPPDKGTKSALLLLPGGAIDSTAYAVTCSKIADRGILVAMVNLEPFRMPLAHLSADPESMKRIMASVEESFGKLNWRGIGGHSMGGRAAAGLSGALGISKVVIWGPGSSVDLLPSDTSALVLIGTNDGLTGRYHAGKMSDRVSVKTIKIEGGNHAGFAHYGPQLYPRPDGELSIPLDEMQSIAAEETAQFLLA